MSDLSYKRKRFKNGTPLWFIIGCIMNYNFRSFSRFLIYIYHFSYCLDLRKKDSSQYTDVELISTLDLIYGNKIDKKDLYTLTDMSKNTFNKYFKDFFEKNNYIGKRKFTLYETYNILNEWQGKGKWGMFNSIKKERLAKIINSGNYKRLASEFKLSLKGKSYKNQDKFSPNQVKHFLEHIDEIETENEEQLLHYSDFKTLSIWAFVIFVTSLYLKNSFFNKRISIQN
ncbi:MAG: hypothetical protein ACPG4Z_02020 [Chitinophagales bacterium]